MAEAPDPKNRTSGGHMVVDGVQFHSYRVGILQYASITPDGRLYVQSNYNASSYIARVDGEAIKTRGKPKRFRYRESAMKAAVAALRGSK